MASTRGRYWTQARREKALGEGHALSPLQGENKPRYPIENCEDVRNAVHDYGRSDPADRPAVRRHIARRAIELGCPEELPEDWHITRGEE